MRKVYCMLVVAGISILPLSGCLEREGPGEIITYNDFEYSGFLQEVRFVPSTFARRETLYLFFLNESFWISQNVTDSYAVCKQFVGSNVTVNITCITTNCTNYELVYNSYRLNSIKEKGTT